MTAETEIANFSGNFKNVFGFSGGQENCHYLNDLIYLLIQTYLCR